MPSATSDLLRLRRRLVAEAVDGAFAALATTGGLLPASWPALHGIARQRGVAYGADPAQVLDIYQPKTPGPWPILIYFHGGGFTALSKDTHWLMGLVFARLGYLAIIPSYRLAPHHPYPAAVEDTAAVCSWVADHAARLGGDPTQLNIGGESAGANLAVAAALLSCTPRPEPWATALRQGPPIRAVLACCGMYRISDALEPPPPKPYPWWIKDRIQDVGERYFAPNFTGDRSLADLLSWVQRGIELSRPIPPMFLPVGSADPLIFDSREMASRLRVLGATTKLKIYPNEIHAFHALLWRPAARECWRDLYDFLLHPSEESS